MICTTTHPRKGLPRPRPFIPLLLGLSVAVGFMSVLCRKAEAAAAEGTAEAAVHKKQAEHEAHEHAYQMGFTGAMLAAMSDGKTEMHSGGGVFFEISAIPGWLDIEISLRALSGGEDVDLPIELLFKKPFHLNHWLHPYLGLGPAVVPVFGREAILTRFGGASAAGLHLWVTGHLALQAEVNYNLLANNGVVHELGGTVGLVLGD